MLQSTLTSDALHYLTQSRQKPPANIKKARESIFRLEPVSAVGSAPEELEELVAAAAVAPPIAVVASPNVGLGADVGMTMLPVPALPVAIAEPDPPPEAADAVAEPEPPEDGIGRDVGIAVAVESACAPLFASMATMLPLLPGLALI